MGAPHVLSVFCDESGDFGPYEAHAPYYLVSFVFHDQDLPLADEISRLEQHVRECGLPANHAIHTAPLIRREQDYTYINMADRRRIFAQLEAFARRSPITEKTFILDKKQFGDGDDLANRIAREMGLFLKEHLPYFLSFDAVIVYYDRGQKQVSKALRLIFSTALSNVEFRTVQPEDYHLFQVADLFCTLELLQRKLEAHTLSKSELAFFETRRNLKKNHLKILEQKQL